MIFGLELNGGIVWSKGKIQCGSLAKMFGETYLNNKLKNYSTNKCLELCVDSTI